MKEIKEYEFESDDYADEIFADGETADIAFELETDDITTVDVGLVNSRKLALQNHIARLKIEQRQERLRLRKLLEDY